MSELSWKPQPIRTQAKRNCYTSPHEGIENTRIFKGRALRHGKIRKIGSNFWRIAPLRLGDKYLARYLA